MNLAFSIVFLECHDVKGENYICLLTLSIVFDLTCALCHNMNSLAMVKKALKTFLQWLFFLLLCYAISLDVRSHSRLITCSGSSSPTQKNSPLTNCSRSKFIILWCLLTMNFKWLPLHALPQRKDTHLAVYVCVSLLWNGNVAFTSQAYALSIALTNLTWVIMALGQAPKYRKVTFLIPFPYTW